MRTLPDSPSLDYLRRQAKDLLMGMRQARPDSVIHLGDAQTALAQQYGFHTWPELKAEVNRRHGGGHIAGPELAQAIASRFGLGIVTAAMKSVAPPNEVGRAWELDTDTGRWTVKQLNSWYGVDDVVANAETDVRLQEAALAIGVLVPRPVRSVSGWIVECIEGQNWRVNAWVPSGPPLSAPVNNGIAHAAGATLARLHALALPPDRPMEPWYTPVNTPEDWARLAARASADRVDWAPRLDDLLVSIRELWSVATRVAPPPGFLCHCGFGPTNARLARDGGLLIIGWEHAGAFPPMWEVANALLAWSAGPHHNAAETEPARSFINGYHGVAGDYPALDLTCFAAGAAAWLNFAYGHVHRALDTADPDERQSMHRGIRHLLRHAPSVALFERVLESASTTGVRWGVRVGASLQFQVMLGPTLTGQLVTLAPLGPEHLEHYVGWFADPEVTQYLARDKAFTLKQEEEWFDRTSRSESDVHWGIFAEGKHIGSTAISQINWRSRHAITGIVIGDKTWWGRGVATEAMALRTRYAFEELGLEKLITTVFEGNPASRRALEKVGYQTVGIYRRHEFRHNQWWDVWIGELLREDWLARRV